jgi:IS30 family transposase
MNTGYTHFSKVDRQELFILRQKGYSLRQIWSVLGKSPSSVSRELRRNQVKWEYIPEKAEHKRYVRRRNSKVYGNKIASDTKLRLYIQDKMKNESWTPEMIHLRLSRIWEQELWWTRELSIKTIYNYIHHHPYGYELEEHLAYKQSKWSTKSKRKWKHIIPHMTSIHERDKLYPEIQEKTSFWHYEFDTLWALKTDTPRIAWGIEKKSRYIQLRKVSRLKQSMEYGFKYIANKHEQKLWVDILTATFDRWVENVNHRKLQILWVQTYFCDAYTSQQKPQIENRFQKLRKFINKGISIENLTHKQLQVIQDKLNWMPMRCLGGKTPSEVFKEHSILHTRE